MIAEVEYIFFVMFGVLCVVLGLLMLKVQSTEPVTITTSEFKTFQSNFLIGYMTVMMGEILCVASFFHILTSLDVSFDDITRLYIVSVGATAVFGVLMEIFDIGTRKDKCVTTACLFALATFTMFSGGNIEILMIGRCLYGAGSVLLHSAFDSFLVNDHASQGFPDDWLMQSFSKLAHGMTIVAIASGIVGQSVASMFGPFGVAILSIIFFICIALFILNMWNKDVGSSTKFMFSSFSQSMGHAMRSLRTNRQMTLVVGLSVMTEASILIFTFYWAPLLTTAFSNSIDMSATSRPAPSVLVFPDSVAITNDASSIATSATRYLQGSMTSAAAIPFVLIYATFVMSTMLGNYIYTLTVSKYGNDLIFQMMLMVNAASFFLASIMTSPQTVFIASIVIQICIGGYWPSIGWLRGRYFMPEVRGVTITLSRVLTFCAVAPILWAFHENYTLTLLACSGLNAVAVYLQFKITQAELRLQGEIDEYEYTEEEDSNHASM